MTKLAPNNQLRTIREGRHLSREQLAKLIGTSRSSIGRWECGDASPNSQLIEKLCTFFQLAPEELGFPPQLHHKTTNIYSVIYDPGIPLTPATTLVGRERELAEVKRSLFMGGSTVLTALNGLPGVGKTALAIALAHDKEVRTHFRDGILWAGLGPEPNVQNQLHRWGTLLGLANGEMDALTSSEAWATALRMAIGARQMLLIIDDAWQAEESLAFKVGGPNCAHLVTTRFPAIALSMGADNTTVVPELDEEESIKLLHQLAPLVIEREDKRVRDLIQAVGGLPLALTLMGNYLRLQAYSGQSRRIHAALAQLSNAEARLQLNEPHAPGERHPSLPSGATLSLQSIIAVTDQQLDEPHVRLALYALSAFPAKPNNFSEEAALAVAACSIETLDALTDAGLLESSGSGRYTLHQTITDYARLHLQETEPYIRLIQYAHNFVDAHLTDYEQLDAESSTIITAMSIAHDISRKEDLIRNVCEFAPFLLMRGNYSLVEKHVERAHEAALSIGDKESTIKTLLYLGQTQQKKSNYSQAEIYLQEGLTFARQIEDIEHISAIMNNLGWVTLKRGQQKQAEEYLKEGLVLARQIGHKERISEILTTLGTVAARKGDYKQSKSYLQEGLTLARQVGNRDQICLLLINIGATEGEQGNYIQSEPYFQEGLALARQIGHREWIAVLLANLGDMASESGNYAQAEAYLQEGLALARHMGHREWISAILNNLATTMRMQNKYSQAETCLQECLHLARQIGRPQIIATALYEYGNVHFNQVNIEAAKANFSEILLVTSDIEQDWLALAQYGLARVAGAQGNILEARRMGETSLTILETMGHRYTQEVRAWLASIEG